MIWIAGRNREQGELVAEAFRAAEGVPRERSAVIAGGLPGAAKDAVLDRHGLDPSRYLTISVDGVLAMMVARSLIPDISIEESVTCTPVVPSACPRGWSRPTRPSTILSRMFPVPSMTWSSPMTWDGCRIRSTSSWLSRRHAQLPRTGDPDSPPA